MTDGSNEATVYGDPRRLTASPFAALAGTDASAAKAGGGDGGGSNGTSNGNGDGKKKSSKPKKTIVRPLVCSMAKAAKKDVKPAEPVVPAQTKEPAKATKAAAEPKGKSKPEAPAKAAVPALSGLAATLEKMERSLTPIGDLHEQIGDLAAQYRDEVALAEGAGEKRRQYEEEIDDLRLDARSHGIDLRRGPNVPAKLVVLRAIEQRENLIRALFLFPLQETDAEAEALLKAFELYRQVRYYLVTEANFGSFAYCLRLAFDAGFYTEITRKEYLKRKRDPEQTNFDDRVLGFRKFHYVLRGRRPGMYMLHRELQELREEAERQAQDERVAAYNALKCLPPADLRKLVDLRTPPPVEPVEFGVYIDTLDWNHEKLSLSGKTPDGARRPVRGVLHLRVAAALMDPDKKQIEVLAATGNMSWFLPEAFKKAGHVVGLVEATAGGWAGQLGSFLYRANTAGLLELIKRWEQDNHVSVIPKPAKKPVVKDGEAAAGSDAATAGSEPSET